MSATGEGENVNVEQQLSEATAAEQPEKQGEERKPAGEKKANAPKEKKPKVPKEKKPKAPKAKAAAHPPYFEMIKEALLALNEKSGSSPYAIAKYMEEKHKAVLPANFRKMLGHQLKNSAARGKLIKIKASYKLSEAGKKVPTGAKKPANAEKKQAKRKVNSVVAVASATKPKAAKKKKTETVKKAVVAAAAKTTTKKRSAPAAKPKQPKSIKSPAAKRARKASATV